MADAPVAVVSQTRAYDEAVIRLMADNLNYPPERERQKPILTVFATPDRAFARATERLQKKYPERRFDNNRYPLPIVSVDPLDSQHDPSRDRPARLRRVLVSEDGQTYYGTRWPSPENRLYQVTVWVRLKRDLDWLHEQFIRMFPTLRYTYLTITHPSPVGSKLVFIKIVDQRILPKIEGPDRKPIFKRVYTLQVEGWIVRAEEETGLVETIIVDTDYSPDMVTSEYDLDYYVVDEDGLVTS